MALEQEIKDFMKSLGVDVVGLAGPGRFDGPPSLDPTYVLKGAKSIICFAVPHDVDAIYAHLSKKSAIPHNIDQIRKMQQTMHLGIKLQKFLKKKGYRSGTVAANSNYRRDPDVFSTYAQFSHRYASYVTGIAAPGISGNAITKEYGATCVLYTVVTDAVLKSDPVLDPRHFYDGRCQECLACKGSCAPKMFESDREEYALINGQLYPRGYKRDIDLCNTSCAGMHGLSANKKWSTWGRTWLPHWVGKEPEVDGKRPIRTDLVTSFLTVPDWAPRLQVLFDSYSTPMEEGLFEDPERFPDYEDLPGNTEGEKLRAYADVLEKIFGFHLEDPLTQTCAQCFQVCGSSAEESLNRFHVLSTSGIVVYEKGNEPKVVDTYEEAAEIHAKDEFKIRTVVKIDNWLLQLKSFFKYFGVDTHTMKHKKKYYEKLAAAEAEANAKKAKTEKNEARIAS